MKYEKKFVVTDKNGEHICNKVGRKVVVTSKAPSFKEAIIDAVRTASHDSSIRPGVEIIKAPDADHYVVKSDSSFYFVRSAGSGIFDVIMDDYTGFEIIRGYSFRGHAEGDSVIFWMVDDTTNERVSNYHYIEW